MRMKICKTETKLLREKKCDKTHKLQIFDETPGPTNAKNTGETRRCTTVRNSDDHAIPLR